MRSGILSVLTALLLCSTTISAAAYTEPIYGDLNGDSVCNAVEQITRQLYRCGAGHRRG